MAYQKKVCPKCKAKGEKLSYMWHHYKNKTKHIVVICPKCNKYLGNAPQREPYLSYVCGTYEGKSANHENLQLSLQLGNTSPVFDAIVIETSGEVLRLKGLKYKKYLESNHWIRTRRKIIKMRKRRCESCGSKKALQGHHIHYETLGKESVIDLVILCKRCHELLHKREME